MTKHGLLETHLNVADEDKLARTAKKQGAFLRQELNALIRVCAPYFNRSPLEYRREWFVSFIVQYRSFQEVKKHVMGQRYPHTK